MKEHTGGGMGRTTEDELIPIDEVARLFGIRASALRYYEKRGLLDPASRQAGRRWYGTAEVRRLAIIGFWQQSGLLSLDEIAAMLAGPADAPQWKQIVGEHVSALNAQIEQMTTARDYLEHMLTCPREHSLDGCPYFEEAIQQPLEQRLAAARVHRRHHAARQPHACDSANPETMSELSRPTSTGAA
jgi:MerR family transcriptional regulator, copper efflux regulator